MLKTKAGAIVRVEWFAYSCKRSGAATAFATLPTLLILKGIARSPAPSARLQLCQQKTSAKRTVAQAHTQKTHLAMSLIVSEQSAKWPAPTRTPAAGFSAGLPEEGERGDD